MKQSKDKSFESSDPSALPKPKPKPKPKSIERIESMLGQRDAFHALPFDSEQKKPQPRKRSIKITEDEKAAERQGKLFNVPQLPPQYLIREIMGEVRSELLSNSVSPVVISGLGGAGKTVLASALARDIKVRQAFPDGIYWLTMSQQEDVLAQQVNAKLTQLIPGRRNLLILDEVNQLNQGNLSDVLNRAGRILATTRNAQLFGDKASYFNIGTLSKSEASEMLAKCVGAPGLEALPHEANELIREYAKLPLTLALLGAIAKLQPDDWTRLLKGPNSPGLANLRKRFPEFTDTDLLLTIQSSVDSLDEDLSSRFKSLAVFASQNKLEIPMTAIASLWQMNKSETLSLLKTLEKCSLLSFDTDSGLVRLHDLIGSYLAQIDPDTSIKASELLKPKERLVAFAGDAAVGEDQLGITTEVNAFSTVLAAKDVEPPLCLGIFGDWGTGKSFFLTKMQERINLLGKESIEAEGKKQPTAFCSHIAQITFNAWHYVDSNLWASLACRIFEGLDEYITQFAIKEQTDPEATKANLFKELQTAKEQREKAGREKELAEGELRKAENTLATLQQERERKSLDLKALRDAAVQEALRGNPKIKQDLEEAAQQLGLMPLVDNVIDLKKRVQELKAFSSRFNVLWLNLLNARDRWERIAFLIAVIAMVPLAGIGINKLVTWLSNSDSMAKFTSLIVQTGAFIGGFTTWLNYMLKGSGKVLNRVEEAQKQVDKILQEARQKPGPEEKKVLKELVSLRDQEANTKQSLEEAQGWVQKAEKKIREIENATDGRCLAEFINERVRSSAYEGHLGIISTIRRDFQALSELLTQTYEPITRLPKNHGEKVHKATKIPEINRIILYIDDLDRCPESKVVEVLQAVHLLLYFKLFIVVIAVDSRWLLRSLQKQYIAFQRKDIDEIMGGVDSSAFRITTPQNFIEKIIQIPFNLRPMGSLAFGRLVTSLVPQLEAEEDSIQMQNQDLNDLTGLGVGLDQEMAASQTPTKPLQGETVEQKLAVGQTTSIPQVEKVDLLPESLKLTKNELNFIEKLAPMVPTPRSAKRLLNIYRLIRASVGAHELARFMGKDESPPDFEPVLVLLALLVGYPLSANRFYKRVIDSDSSETWVDFIEKLPSNLSQTTTSGSSVQNQDQLFAQALKDQQLHKFLSYIKSHLSYGLTLESFKRWVPRVSRYSFRGTG